MTPGGIVVGVNVLLTATVTLFHFPGSSKLLSEELEEEEKEERAAVNTSTSNGKWPPTC